MKKNEINTINEISHYRNPFIPDNFINGQPFFGICFETTLDELLGVLGYVCPLRLWELVLPWNKKIIMMMQLELIFVKPDLIRFFIPGEIGRPWLE